jgi:ribonuclease BN (tRNA processing enzyme)
MDAGIQDCASTEPRTLILTHLYPEWDGVDIAQEAVAFWQGQVVAALPGLRLQVLRS